MKLQRIMLVLMVAGILALLFPGIDFLPWGNGAARFIRELLGFAALCAALALYAGERTRRAAAEQELQQSRSSLKELAAVRARDLRESEEKYRTIVETANEGILVFDVEGQITYGNRRMAEMLGYGLDEMIGKTGFYFADEESRALGRLPFERRRQGSRETIEFKLCRKNGAPLWVLVNITPLLDKRGRLAGSMGMYTDITERRRAEELLRASERKARALLNAADDSIALFDLEGRILAANAAACRRLRMGMTEILGGKIDELLPPRLAALYADKIARVVATGEPVRFEEEAADGIFDFSMHPVRDADGTVIEIAGFCRDITTLRRLTGNLEALVLQKTQQLVNAHTELSRTQRMADIGRLASTIAHELRNPLAGIKVAAYNVKRKAQNPSLDRYLVHINQKIMEGDQIIQNLLSFTRIKTVEFGPVALRGTLERCIGAVRERHAGKTGIAVSLSVDCAGGDAIEADQTQMLMLFINVIDNAFQSIVDPTGRVTVAAKLGDRCEVSISDTGTGIDAAILEKIYNPFFTTKSKGTGLGLTICREIVDLHRGAIAVASVPGSGTTFTITLPLKQPVAAPADKTLFS